ncbi:MAG: SPOR domain-containing protein [Alcanivoracaceae bacterium]|jgi:DedD protein|nr:SPOR domain-containing protein [Alcanivoracaceae bacterium]
MKSPLRHPLVALLLLALVAAMLVPLWQRQPVTVMQPLDMELPSVPVMAPADPTEPVSELELRSADAEINAGRDALVRQTDSGDGDQPALPRAWAVQLLSYQSEQEAGAAKQRLLDAGYRAFLRRTLDGQLWQLYAGPELEQESAEATLARLQFELLAPTDAQVVPFRP